MPRRSQKNRDQRTPRIYGRDTLTRERKRRVANERARMLRYVSCFNSLDAQMQTTVGLESVTRRFQGKPENSVSRAASRFLNCDRFSHYTDDEEAQREGGEDNA